MALTKSRSVVTDPETFTTTDGAPLVETLPTALYTHPTSSYTFTGITASGPAIYISGFNVVTLEKNHRHPIVDEILEVYKSFRG